MPSKDSRNWGNIIATVGIITSIVLFLLGRVIENWPIRETGVLVDLLYVVLVVIVLLIFILYLAWKSVSYKRQRGDAYGHGVSVGRREKAQVWDTFKKVIAEDTFTLTHDRPTYFHRLEIPFLHEHPYEEYVMAEFVANQGKADFFLIDGNQLDSFLARKEFRSITSALNSDRFRRRVSDFCSLHRYRYFSYYLVAQLNPEEYDSADCELRVWKVEYNVIASGGKSQ